MEAVNPPTMPSQAQMAYAQRTTALHSRSHATPSGADPSASSSPYKPAARLPPLPSAPSSHQQYAGAGGGGATLTQQAPAAVRFVSHLHAAANQQLHYSPRYNHTMIVRDSIPPPGSRLDNSSGPPPPQIRTRIPLLAAQQYLTSPAHGNEHGGGGLVISLPSIDLNPPAKKLRLSEGPSLVPPPLGLVKSDPHQPLRIDTRDHTPNTGTVLRGGGGGSVYNPQVEAISPTLPPDPVKPEDTTLKTVKDDLIGKIGKVDKDIASTETLVTDLKAKEKTLEETLKRLLEEQEAVKPRPPSLSPAQKVYKRNRELAQESHATLTRLGPPIHLPIYNQPMDSPSYQVLRERHAEFRPRLVDLIRKRKQEEATRKTKLTETYCTLAAQWFKKVEKIENSSKRKAREAKAREVYEKMFPEIRKNREDKERFSRVGARVKSDADLAEIMDGLQEQEAEDRRRHSLSVIPPIITDRSRAGRPATFINNNGRVTDYAGEMKARAQAKMWTPAERELFRDKYIHHQKNFGLIASFLERKTPADCVEFYYQSKKRENYKRAIRYNKSRARTRGNKLSKGGHANNSSLPPLDPIFNNTGVTTRLQREQLIKQEPRVKQDRDKTNSNSSSTTGANEMKPDSASTTPVKEEKQRGVTPVPSVVPPTTNQPPPVSSSCDNRPTSTPPATSSPSLPTSTTTLSSTTGLLTTTPLQRNSASPVAAPPPTSSISRSHPPTSSSSTSSNSMTSSTTTEASSSHYNHPGSSIAPSIVSSSNSAPPSSNSFSLVSTLSSTIPSSLHNHYPPPPVSSPSGGVALRRSPLVGNGGMPPSGATSLMNHHHHHHHSGIGELRLEMKKKERRKEDKNRDGEFDDTSEDEARDNQEADKPRLPHECHVCHKLVTVSRRLARSHAVRYGLTEDDIPPADTKPPARVCLACHAQARHRFTVCPIPSCVNHSSPRAKRLRALPSKFHSLPPHLKSTLASEFQISPSITKCCSLCYSRVQKRLLSMGIEDVSSRPVSPSSGATSPLLRWTEEETELLKKGLRECGTKWSEVSAIVGVSKTMHQCKSFYFSYRKNLGLDLLVQEYNKNHFGSERKPVLTDEEESGSSTSSCDGLLAGPGGAGAGLIDSDTTSAPSPSQGAKPSPLCPPRVSESSDTTGSLPPTTHRSTPTRPSSNHAPPTRLGEDYDSSATETADEGVTEHGGATSSPLTVKDLMLGVIEISLKNSAPSLADPNAQGNTKSNPPTISSILKSSEPGPSLPPVGQGGPPPPPPPQTKPISMVQHRSNPAPAEAEPVTLDLSIKKPRSNADPPYPLPSKPTATLSLPQHVSAMYRPAPEKGGAAGPPGAYYHLEVGGRRTPDMYGAPGPAGMMSGGPLPRPPTPSHMKPSNVRITSLSPGQHQQATHRLSPSQAQQQGGGVKLTVLPSRHPQPDPRYSHSDTLGGMKDSPGGSITQGTPVHARLYPPNDRGGPPPPPEFYGKPSPQSQPGSGGPSPAHRSSEPLPQPRSSSNPPPPTTASSPFYPPRAPPSTSNEQQQILMNDYITAKHMTGVPPTPPRGSRGDKATPPAQAPPNVSPAGANSAAAAMFYQPTRQGVIQRHNTSKPPSPHFPPPPGHEAFSSLVETAVRQPSLPVPGGPPDHHKERDRLQSALAHHEGLGQRFTNHDRYPPPASSQRDAQERFARESAVAAHQQQQRELQQARDREIQRERDLIAARELVAAQAQAQARDRELQQLRDQAILREHTIRELQRREEQQKAMIRDSQLMQQQQREREILHIREREMMAEHMAAQRSRLSSEQARMHQMQMAVFQQQQQHHHAATVAAVAAAQQRERESAVARLNSSPHDRRLNAASPLETRAGKTGGGGGGSERSSSSQSGASMGSNGGADGKLGPGGGDPRPQLVTAASLIDAIITHQINQPVDQGGPGPGERGHLPSPQSGMMNPANPAPGNRAGDRLFQMDFNQKKVSVSPRLDVPANGKVSPATASIMSRQGGLKLSSPGGDKAPPGQMTLNEQIESMMRHGGPPPGPHNLTASPYETQAWKLRRALAKEEEHHLPHHRKQGSSPAGIQSSPGPPQGPRYYGDPVPTMSPLDYVKNRIAEVMRTSEEDKGPCGDDDAHPAPSPQGGGRHMMVPSPYGMMQQAPSPVNRPPSRPVTGHHAPPMHDPGKPLMSDQFEPLSDDD